MTNETFRSNNIPQETQAMIDAANARADRAEAQVESLSERRRLVLVYGIFLGILLKGWSLEYLGGVHASVRSFFSALTSMTMVWDAQPSALIHDSPAPNPSTSQIRIPAWNAHMGMIRVDTTRARGHLSHTERMGNSSPCPLESTPTLPQRIETATHQRWRVEVRGAQP